MLMKELMLHEKKHKNDPHEIILVEPGGGEYGEFEVRVYYDAQEPSSSRHVQDDPTTTEHHPGSLDIVSIELNGKVHERDEDGKIVKSWDKGFDAKKLPGWNKKDTEYVEDRLIDILANED